MVAGTTGRIPAYRVVWGWLWDRWLREQPGLQAGIEGKGPRRTLHIVRRLGGGPVEAGVVGCE